MIGQKVLLDKLETFTLDTFPKSSMLLGKQGCGKHTYLKLITQKLNLPSLDITDVVSFEYILEIYSRKIPTIYYIDIDKFTEKKQNVILKLLEEPPISAYLVLLCSDKSLVLETILNRCIVFEFEKYRIDELRPFIESGDDIDLIGYVLETPGQILSSNIDNLHQLKDLCETIINKIQLASYCNTLEIANKINYKDEYDKFDLDIFFKMLDYVMINEYIKTKNESIPEYIAINYEYKKRLAKDKRLDRQKLFENYLSELWRLSR